MIVLSGEEFKESKPNPEIYLTALQHLNVEANQALIIEDSEKGIAAGVAAGVEASGPQRQSFWYGSRCSHLLDKSMMFSLLKERDTELVVELGVLMYQIKNSKFVDL